MPIVPNLTGKSGDPVITALRERGELTEGSPPPKNKSPFQAEADQLSQPQVSPNVLFDEKGDLSPISPVLREKLITNEIQGILADGKKSN